MTRALLDLLASARGSVALQVLVGTLALVLLPFTLLIDLACWGWHQWRFRQVLGQGETLCPAGHAVKLVGAFECAACHFCWSGHAFEPCPVCGAQSHVQCACGLTVQNPLVETRP